MANKELDIRTVTNPLGEDFTHTYDKAPFTVHAYSVEPFVAAVAEHLAKHLAKKVLISKGRFRDKIVDGKPVGSGVSQSEVEYIKNRLLDVEEDSLDLNEIVGESRKAKGALDEEVTPNKRSGSRKITVKNEKELDDVPEKEDNVVKEPEGEKEPEIDMSPMRIEYERMKELKAWTKGPEQKARYNELKKKLNLL